MKDLCKLLLLGRTAETLLPFQTFLLWITSTEGVKSVGFGRWWKLEPALHAYSDSIPVCFHSSVMLTLFLHWSWQFSLLNLVGGNTRLVINQCQRAQRKYLKGLRKLKFLPGCEVLTCSSSRSTSPTITMLMFPPIVPSLKRLDTWRRHKEMCVHEGMKDWMRIELLLPDHHYHHHFHYSNNKYPKSDVLVCNFCFDTKYNPKHHF